MGDNYLEEQAKYAKRRRAREKSQLQQGVLFRRPDLLERFFTLRAIGSEPLVVGEIVIVVKTDQPDELDVHRENRLVGKIDGDGAKSLISAMEAGIHAATMRVSSVGALSGAANAQLLVGES